LAEPRALTREQMERALARWIAAWNAHDLDGVMELMHEDVLFENWTGARVKGKRRLQRAWAPWFAAHGGFRFVEEETCFDEVQQKALFRWRLLWPSRQEGHAGEPEQRKGVDVLHFQDGKILRKLTYTKTRVEVGGRCTPLDRG